MSEIDRSLPARSVTAGGAWQVGTRGATTLISWVRLSVAAGVRPAPGSSTAWNVNESVPLNSASVERYWMKRAVVPPGYVMLPAVAVPCAGCESRTNAIGSPSASVQYGDTVPPAPLSNDGPANVVQCGAVLAVASATVMLTGAGCESAPWSSWATIAKLSPPVVAGAV